MKKKIFIGMFVLLSMFFAVYGMSVSMNNNAKLNNLVLENVEALAMIEGVGGSSFFPNCDSYCVSGPGYCCVLTLNTGDVKRCINMRKANW